LRQPRRAIDRLAQLRLADVLQTAEFLRAHDQATDAMIAEWNLSGMGDVTAILRTGATVRVGTQSPLKVFDKLSAAIRDKPRVVEQAAYLDLRMDRQVVYKLRDEQ